jgi:chromosome segregation ATPase
MADLEMQLRQAQDELEAVKTRSLDHTQGTNELELQTSLEAAREAERAAEARAEKLEDRLQNLVSSLKAEQAERGKRVEAELRALRGERDDLNARLANEQQDAVTTVRRAEELEEQLARNAAEAERAKAELARQNEAHQLSESEWKEQLDSAWSMKSKLEAECAGALERNKQVEEELAKLRGSRRVDKSSPPTESGGRGPRSRGASRGPHATTPANSANAAPNASGRNRNGAMPSRPPTPTRRS